MGYQYEDDVITQNPSYSEAEGSDLKTVTDYDFIYEDSTPQMDFVSYYAHKRLLRILFEPIVCLVFLIIYSLSDNTADEPESVGGRCGDQFHCCALYNAAGRLYAHCSCGD